MDMVKRDLVERFDVYLISLDPTKGSEIKKTRPCLIISPDEMNRHIRTVIIAPMTSTIKNYPSRVTTTFQKKRGQIVLDQITKWRGQHQHNELTGRKVFLRQV